NPARRRLTVSRALALVHMSLNVPGGNRNHRKGQDHVEGIGRLENHEARLVIPARFAVVYQRELDRETIDAIVPASTWADNHRCRSLGWRRIAVECTHGGLKTQHVEVVGAGCIRPIDFKVVGGLSQVAVDFEAFGDRCHTHNDLLSTTCEASSPWITVVGDSNSHAAVLTIREGIVPNAIRNRVHYTRIGPG